MTEWMMINAELCGNTLVKKQVRFRHNGNRVGVFNFTGNTACNPYEIYKMQILYVIADALSFLIRE